MNSIKGAKETVEEATEVIVDGLNNANRGLTGILRRKHEITDAFAVNFGTSGPPQFSDEFLDESQFYDKFLDEINFCALEIYGQNTNFGKM